MADHRMRRAGVQCGLVLVLTGLVVSLFWPQQRSWAGGGLDQGVSPEDCIDMPTTALPTPGLAGGGGNPGPDGGYPGDPTSPGDDDPCYEGWDRVPRSGVKTWSSSGLRCDECKPCEYSTSSGQSYYTWYDLVWRECPDGYESATTTTSRMAGTTGGHEGTAGMGWFTLWDPYIETSGSGVDLEYHVVLGPDLMYSFDDQLNPLCSEADTDGVTLDDDATDLLTLTMKRGVSTVTYEFHDFTQSTRRRGQFSAYQTDKSRFHVTSYSTSQNILQITRTPYKDGVAQQSSERMNFGLYNVSGYRGSAYHEYKDGQAWKTTRYARYNYDSLTGNLESLEYRTGYDGIDSAAHPSNWDDAVGKAVFRYDSSHRLTMVLDTEAVASAEAAGLDVDLDTAGNNTSLEDHATRIYTYHDDDGGNKPWREGMVASVKGEGCGGCGSAGSEIAISWAQNSADLTNHRYDYWWRRSTEEMKDDNGAVYRRTTKYINRAGKTLCRIVESGSATYGEGGTLEHAAITFYEYDSAGRLTKVYESSAVDSYPTETNGEVKLSTLDTKNQLKEAGGLVMHTDEGVVRVTEYWGASPSPAAGASGARGGVEGYVRYQKLQEGANGTANDVTLSETLYTKHSYGGEDVYPVAEVKRFLEGTGEWASTVWVYTWHTGSNDIDTIERHRFVNENENTPDTNDALVLTVVNSEEGRQLWRKDERGLITYYLYDDDTLQRTGMIVDVETDHADLSGVTIPTGFANANGTHLRTDTETDEYNRVVKVTGPETSADTDDDGVMDETVRPVRWTVYVDGEYDSVADDWTDNEVRTASGYLEGATYHLVGGISVRVTERGEDTNGVHWSESWVTERGATTGELTSGEAVDTRPKMSGWARTKSVNGQVTERHAYVEIPGSGYGDPADEYLVTTTDYYPDGSVKYTEGPDGLRHYTFMDKKTVSTVDYWETRRYAVYDDGGTLKLAGPISVSWANHDRETVRTFMATTSNGLYGAVTEDVGGDDPAGTDALTALSRTTMTYDWRHRALERWGYFDLASLTESQDGTEGTNYVVSETLAYDDQGRTLRIQDPSGDVTGYVYDALGRTKQVWAGTDATAATREDPGNGASNLAMVSRSFFDADGDGTGAPTADLIRAERLKPNLTSSVQDTTRTGEFTGTTSVYDLFGRRTHTKPDVGPWSRVTYSDAGAATESIAYKNGELDNSIDNADLLAQSATLYDGMGRVTESRTYAVDGVNAPSSYLQSTVGYDALGRQAWSFNAQGAGSYTEWDDAGRVVRQATFYTNDQDTDPDDTDKYVTETTIAYLTSGKGAGRPFLRTSYQRNDGDVTTTGFLSDLSYGTAPHPAQRTFTATWYDDAGRSTHTAYYGNNGHANLTDYLPGAAGTTYVDGPPAPDSSDDVLVSKTDYDDLGRGYLVTANDGVQTRLYFDDAGRRTHVVEAYDATASLWDTDAEDPDNPDSRGADVNRITAYVYDSQLGAVVQQVAVDPDHDGNTSDNQVTKYVYSEGSVPSGTPAGGLESNRLLRAVIYPDSDDTTALGDGTDSSYDRVELAYYSDGTLKTRKDQRGVVLTNVYHDDGALQYQDNNSASVSFVNDAVQSIGYAYDDLRRVTTVTSYDEPSTKSGGLGSADIVNQVVNAYTDLGQFATQHQEHDGEKDGSTLSVGYGYDSTVASNVYTKDARLTGLTHPGGAANTSASTGFGYGSDGSITHELGVVSVVEDDDGTDLVQYKYFGLTGLAEARYPGPANDVTRTTHFGDSDGDYEGYDRFYRLVDHYWYQSGGSPARIKYGYDSASRRVYAEDTAAGGNDLDQLDTRNAFGELTNWKLGDVNTSNGTMTSTSEGRLWDLDQAGNWESFGIDANGNGDYASVGDLAQDRDYNDANEIDTDNNHGNTIGDAISATTGDNWQDPRYDAAGNMDILPQPGDPTQPYYAQYDAWGRLVVLLDASVQKLAEYEYDGVGRRIIKHVYDAGSYDYSDHFYYTGWQCIEVRRDTDGTKGGDPDADPIEQLVYHPYYIDAAAVRYYDASVDGTQDLQYLLHDAQFSVIALLDDAGAELERYRYTPYGDQVVMNASFVEKSGTDYDQSIGFTGQRLDQESGLWHFKRRPYHAQLGQFLSPDPKGYIDGMNLRAGWFAALGSVDPLGLWTVKRDSSETKAIATPAEGGESLQSLADQIGLDVSEFKEWLTLLDTEVKVAFDEPRALETLYPEAQICEDVKVPNTIAFAMLLPGKSGDQLTDAYFKLGLELRKKHEEQLKNQNYHIVTHLYAEGAVADKDAESEFISSCNTLWDNKDIYGMYLDAHGQVGYFYFAGLGNTGRYSEFNRNYGLAFGYFTVCEAGWGASDKALKRPGEDGTFQRGVPGHTTTTTADAWAEQYPDIPLPEQNIITAGAPDLMSPNRLFFHATKHCFSPILDEVQYANLPQIEPGE